MTWGLWAPAHLFLADHRLVPVLAVGFPDVKSRLEMQQAETLRQSNKLNDFRKRLDELTSKHTLSNSVRIAAISRKQTSLHHRLISIAKRIHLLIPALRGQSVTLREEQLKSILHNCEMELESISSGSDGRGQGSNHNYTTRLRGRINELWALLGTLKAKREAAMASDGSHNQLEWAVVDESALDDVAKVRRWCDAKMHGFRLTGLLPRFCPRSSRASTTSARRSRATLQHSKPS